MGYPVPGVGVGRPGGGLLALVVGQGGGPHLARLKCQHCLGAYTQEGVRLGVDPYNERLIPVVGSLK